MAHGPESRSKCERFCSPQAGRRTGFPERKSSSVVSRLRGSGLLERRKQPKPPNPPAWRPSAASPTLRRRTGSRSPVPVASMMRLAITSYTMDGCPLSCSSLQALSKASPMISVIRSSNTVPALRLNRRMDATLMSLHCRRAFDACNAKCPGFHEPGANTKTVVLELKFGVQPFRQRPHQLKAQSSIG
jgi:hypothetical protein